MLLVHLPVTRLTLCEACLRACFFDFVQLLHLRSRGRAGCSVNCCFAARSCYDEDCLLSSSVFFNDLKLYLAVFFFCQNKPLIHSTDHSNYLKPNSCLRPDQVHSPPIDSRAFLSFLSLFLSRRASSSSSP